MNLKHSVYITIPRTKKKYILFPRSVSLKLVGPLFIRLTKVRSKSASISVSLGTDWWWCGSVNTKEKIYLRIGGNIK